jgi:hypothetical protein
MDNGTFDALTRRAALVTLGVAGLAALASPTANAKSTTKKKAKKKCQQQVGQCATYLTGVCSSRECPPELITCCDRLAVCDFARFQACFVEAFSAEEGP